MSKNLNRFNTIAPYYDRLAKIIFGNAIVKAQADNLDLISANANVLVLGGGTGKWLGELLQINGTCRIWYIEASSIMLAEAVKINSGWDRIEFIHGTHEDIPVIDFDVVITHFFVDMFSKGQLSLLTEGLIKKMNSGGLWLVADFVNQKLWHRLFLKLMYFCFRVVGAIELKSLVNWDEVIRSKSFLIKKSTTYYGDFIHSNVYQLT